MKVVFMGTPLFSVPTLEKLIENYEVVLVVTQPDKPNKRGNKVEFSPIKQIAIDNNIEVYQPNKIKTVESVEKLKRYDADVFIVVAYGQILSEELLKIPKFGCINIHGSILPKYRGPAPIHYSVLNGDAETGVTIMYMNKGMDTGDIIKIKKMPILDSDNTGTIHDKMCVLGADALIEVLNSIENGNIQTEKQNEAEATYCKLLQKEEGHLDFSKTSREVFNLVRGMTPHPSAYFIIDEKKYKVAKVSISKIYNDEKPSTVLKGSNEGEIIIKTKDGSIKIDMIQKPGGKMIETSEFVKGNKNLVETGTVVE